MDEHLSVEKQHLEEELYEKIVVRERRRKGLIIAFAFALFLFLCGIPIYNERLPKWQSLEAARKIGVEIEKMKTESLHLKKPLQLSILDGGQLKVEQVDSCNQEKPAAPEKLREGTWTDMGSDFSLLHSEEAKKLNLNWAVNQICFDPVTGVSSPKTKKVFVVVPVKDLAQSRLDRASYVEIETSSARISIN